MNTFTEGLIREELDWKKLHLLSETDVSRHNGGPIKPNREAPPKPLDTIAL